MKTAWRIKGQGSGRLESITHLSPQHSALSTFNYTYDPAGQIQTWTSQDGALAPVIRGLGYDLAGQLTSTATSGGAFAGSSTWAYDAAGNRTNQTQSGLVTNYVANALNQLTQTQPAQLQVKGLVSQAAAVQVNGLPATVAPDNSFAAQVPAPAGSQVITVTAQAGAAHSSQHFKVQNGQTLTYDLDGNMTSDGIHQYDWDAANRLIRISDLHPSVGTPAHVSEFTYDGLWRRVEIKEKQGLQTVADRKFVWAGAEIKEERDQSNNVVKRFYGSGVQVVQGPLGGVYIYTRDHLGSVRGVLDGAGNQVAAYDYDVWGNRTQTAGTFVADFGYAGYFEHGPSGLKLTWFRGYSPLLGRWISRDPMGIAGGLNLYGYGSNPMAFIDRYGLCPDPTPTISPTPQLTPTPPPWAYFPPMPPHSGPDGPTGLPVWFAGPASFGVGIAFPITDSWWANILLGEVASQALAPPTWTPTVGPTVNPTQLPQRDNANKPIGNPAGSGDSCPVTK